MEASVDLGALGLLPDGFKNKVQVAAYLRDLSGILYAALPALDKLYFGWILLSTHLEHLPNNPLYEGEYPYSSFLFGQRVSDTQGTGWICDEPPVTGLLLVLTDQTIVLSNGPKLDYILNYGTLKLH